MSSVVIFGTGDFARIAAVYLDIDSEHEVVAFCVDQQYRDVDELLGRPVVDFEGLEVDYPPDEYRMFVAIGFSKVNEARAAAYDRAKARGYELISYVNSEATHWGKLDIGDNVFIFENNVIQPFVRIGNDVILWSGNHVGHDVTIEDHCFIASHAVISGNVTIGQRCFVGVNATFRDGVEVAPRCVIGAAAVVMRDTDEGDVLGTRHTAPISKRSWELKGF